MAEHQSAPHLPTSDHGEPEQHAHEHDASADDRSFLSSIIAIVGFIILIVIVIWGLVHLITLGGNWITSLSGKTQSAIEVSAPGSVTSGQQFTLSWKYTPATQGTYAFLYPCANGLSFKTAGPTGALYVIPCGAAYTMPVTNNSLALTPTLTATSSLVTPVSIIFLPSSTSTSITTGQAQGSTTLTVNPAASTSATKPSTSSSSGKSTSYHSSSYAASGPADLAVSQVSGTVDANGNATVTFDIGNIGGSSSGTYYFTATLPISSGSYTSPVQGSLNPGDHVVNTLRFGPVSGSGLFSVTVIPGGADVNSANNTGTFTLASSYNGSYNYNNGYPTPATNYNYNIGGAYYPNTYPYTPQPCGYYYTQSTYPCQNQPLYYTNGSQPYYNYPYNQYQPYQYQSTYPYSY